MMPLAGSSGEVNWLLMIKMEVAFLQDGTQAGKQRKGLWESKGGITVQEYLLSRMDLEGGSQEQIGAFVALPMEILLDFAAKLARIGTPRESSHPNSHRTCLK